MYALNQLFSNFISAVKLYVKQVTAKNEWVPLAANFSAESI